MADRGSTDASSCFHGHAALCAGRDRRATASARSSSRRRLPVVSLRRVPQRSGTPAPGAGRVASLSGLGLGPRNVLGARLGAASFWRPARAVSRAEVAGGDGLGVVGQLAPRTPQVRGGAARRPPARRSHSAPGGWQAHHPPGEARVHDMLRRHGRPALDGADDDAAPSCLGLGPLSQVVRSGRGDQVEA